jgi:carboxymethylenebutenolidase
MPHSTLTIGGTSNQPFTGYLTSTSSDKKPGIVMIPEIFGVNPSIQEAADRFAEEGYVVLAPDIFWRFKTNVQLGYEGADLEEAFDYYKRFDVKQGVQDLLEAVSALKHHANCNGQVAVLGFCLGGKLSYLTAAAHTAVNAMVAFYGGGIADHLNVAKKITCPVLMHFGEKDESISPEQVEMIQQAFAEHSDATIEVYPGVGHAFFNSHRRSYHAAAAQLAAERTFAFLKRVLGG